MNGLQRQQPKKKKKQNRNQWLSYTTTSTNHFWRKRKIKNKNILCIFDARSYDIHTFMYIKTDALHTQTFISFGQTTTNLTPIHRQLPPNDWMKWGKTSHRQRTHIHGPHIDTGIYVWLCIHMIIGRTGSSVCVCVCACVYMPCPHIEPIMSVCLCTLCVCMVWYESIPTKQRPTNNIVVLSLDFRYSHSISLVYIQHTSMPLVCSATRCSSYYNYTDIYTVNIPYGCMHAKNVGKRRRHSHKHTKIVHPTAQLAFLSLSIFCLFHILFISKLLISFLFFFTFEENKKQHFSYAQDIHFAFSIVCRLCCCTVAVLSMNWNKMHGAIDTTV